MTIYYVGIGGSDIADGQSWANRKETLNGAEDIPVTGGDIVYVGPGTYREMLTVDVDGSSGNEITYIADVTGINTDDVGGQVRLTGSDNDQTATRDQCIYSATLGQFRVFRSFLLDMSAYSLFFLYQPDGTVFEYCVFGETPYNSNAYRFVSSSTNSWGDSSATFRNCIFVSNVYFFDGTAPNTALVNLENCLFLNLTGANDATHSYYVPMDINNCTFMWWGKGTVANLTVAGGSIDVTNSIFASNGESYDENSGGVLNVDHCNSSHWYWSPGGTPTVTNSNTWPALMSLPLLSAGYRLPFTIGHLEGDSHLRHIAGAGEETADLWGITRPTSSAKKSWGATQFTDISFEDSIKTSGVASIEMEDAEREHAYVRVRGELLTVRVKVYREADYAGTNPQLVLKTPGVSTETDTDTGPAEQFNQLSATIEPTTPYVLVELVSNNTASGTDFKVYWDDFEIAP